MNTAPVVAVASSGTAYIAWCDQPAAGCSQAKRCPFATLQPTNQEQLGNVPGTFASQSGAHPGALGVFSNGGGSAPYACPNHDNIPYVYGSGNQSGTNDYNASPGSPNSAWRVPLSLGLCNAQNPGVAEGRVASG